VKAEKDGSAEFGRALGIKDRSTEALSIHEGRIARRYD
jgi:hypothetical protein